MKHKRIRWLLVLFFANVLASHADTPPNEPILEFMGNTINVWTLEDGPLYNVKMKVEYEDIYPTLELFGNAIDAWILEIGPLNNVKMEVEYEDIPQPKYDFMKNAIGVWTLYEEFLSDMKMVVEYEDTPQLSLDFVDNGDDTWTLDEAPDFNTKMVVEYESVLPEIALLDNADNSPVLTANEGLLVDATLQDRTLCKDGKWNTLTLPFDVPSLTGTPLEGATVKELDVTGKNGLDAGTGTLYLSFKTATQIEAGKPYLVKWESGTDIVEPVFTDVTITSTAPTAVVSATSGLEEVTMTGNYSPVSVAANDQSIMFMGGDNTLYYTTTDRTLRCFRAHFGIESQNKVNSFVMNFGDDVATGVSLVQSQEPADDSYYDLQGRKLSGKPTKAGIYINQGRKISVK